MSPPEINDYGGAPVATHNHACAVCLRKPSVLNLNTGAWSHAGSASAMGGDLPGCPSFGGGCLGRARDNHPTPRIFCAHAHRNRRTCAAALLRRNILPQ